MDKQQVVASVQIGYGAEVREARVRVEQSGLGRPALRVLVPTKEMTDSKDAGVYHGGPCVDVTLELFFTERQAIDLARMLLAKSEQAHYTDEDAESKVGQITTTH